MVCHKYLLISIKIEAVDSVRAWFHCNACNDFGLWCHLKWEDNCFMLRYHDIMYWKWRHMNEAHIEIKIAFLGRVKVGSPNTFSNSFCFRIGWKTDVILLRFHCQELKCPYHSKNCKSYSISFSLQEVFICITSLKKSKQLWSCLVSLSDCVKPQGSWECNRYFAGSRCSADSSRGSDTTFTLIVVLWEHSWALLKVWHFQWGHEKGNREREREPVIQAHLHKAH